MTIIGINLEGCPSYRCIIFWSGTEAMVCIALATSVRVVPSIEYTSFGNQYLFDGLSTQALHSSNFHSAAVAIIIGQNNKR